MRPTTPTASSRTPSLAGSSSTRYDFLGSGARRERPRSAGPSRSAAQQHPMSASGGEWAAATQRLIVGAASDKVMSGTVRADSRAVRSRAAKDTQRHDRTVRHVLEQKVNQTAALQRSLRRAIQGICDEVALLQRSRSRSVNALNARQAPLDLSRRRLRIRRARPDRENLDDEPQHALRVEAEDITACVRALAGDVREADRLLEQMDTVQRVLEADLADKLRAQALDAGCLDLPAQQQGQPTGFRERIGSAMRMADALLTDTGTSAAADDIRMLAASVSRHHPVEWREATHRNTQEAAELVAASRALRHAAKMRLRDVQESNAAHHERVRKSLVGKMRATAALHKSLSEQIHSVNGELAGLERDREQAELALREKERPFRQCVERLAIRRDRPHRESAADDVERELKDQLSVMAQAIRRLERAHDAIVARQANLRKARQRLELDRADKAAALEVDKEAYNALPYTGVAAQNHPSSALLEQTMGSAAP